MTRRSVRLATPALIGLALFVTGCTTGTPDTTGEGNTADTSGSHTDTHVSAQRVAVAYEGGIAVLDANTLDVINEFPSEEFTRLNAAGDGKHILVTTSKGFQLLDTAEPSLTNLVVPAKAAGHVVRHAGKTVLFDDGTGETSIFDTHELAHTGNKLPEAVNYTAPNAHHGVSIELGDGTLLTTVGDETARTGAAALERRGNNWEELATSTDCPNIHGEGTAANEAVVFGCEDGALLYTNGEFTKLKAPDAYGRMGNAYVSETSPIVVGDYKSDPDAEGYLLSAVTLIDTVTKQQRVVRLPENVRYTWRDVIRGADDLAYILSTDGAVHVLNPETGELVNAFPVIDAWEGPTDWQLPHPALIANGDTAFVTDPAAKAIHSIDLRTGNILATGHLDHVPNEFAVTLGAH